MWKKWGKKKKIALLRNKNSAKNLSSIMLLKVAIILKFKKQIWNFWEEVERMVSLNIPYQPIGNLVYKCTYSTIPKRIIRSLNKVNKTPRATTKTHQSTWYPLSIIRGVPHLQITIWIKLESLTSPRLMFQLSFEDNLIGNTTWPLYKYIAHGDNNDNILAVSTSLT